MVAGRPLRIVLAALGIGIVGVATLVGFVGPIIADLNECAGMCSYGTPTPVLVAIPSAAVVLGIGLLLWPAVLARPMALGTRLIAILLIIPVLQLSSADLAVAVLCVFGAATFLLAPPLGRGVGRWARASWLIAIAGALVLWQLDTVGSSFMVTDPVGPQPAFMIVAGAMVGAGLLSSTLHRLEGEDDEGENDPDHVAPR